MKSLFKWWASFVLPNLCVAIVVHYCDIKFSLGIAVLGGFNLYWAVVALAASLLIVLIFWILIKALASLKRWLVRKALHYIDCNKDKIRQILGL